MSPVTRCGIVTEVIVWNAIEIEVSYEAEWLGADFFAHLQLRSLEPADAPLPVTETGYRSHFLKRESVENAGGPTAYVTAWLDEAANSKAWIAAEDARRQLSLF